jgi:Putative beta-barrel porin-2, OmpL-like. bbp2
MRAFSSIAFPSLVTAFIAVSGLAAEKIAPKTLEFLQDTTLSGYVQTSYQHTFVTRDSPGVAGARQLDANGDAFSINQAKLALEHPLDDAEAAAGFRVDLIAGQDAQRIHSYGLFSSNTNELTRRQGTGSTSEMDLEQAYVNFRVPVGSGLEVKFGKFVSPAGAETIDAPANWFFSHSYIFGFGEPFTLTGVLLSYQWNDWLDTQAGVVNGWDAVQDNNSGKTAVGRVGVTLFDGKLKNAVTIISGPEQPGNDSNNRWIVDDVLTWQPPMENLQLTFNALYGSEDGRVDSAGVYHGGTATWWGAVASARYQWTPFVAMAVRGEYFSDADGARTDGAGGIGPAPLSPLVHGLDYEAVTWSVWLERLWPNLTPRVEVRWDRANRPVFQASSAGNDGSRTQVSVSLDVIYAY